MKDYSRSIARDMELLKAVKLLGALQKETQKQLDLYMAHVLERLDRLEAKDVRASD